MLPRYPIAHSPHCEVTGRLLSCEVRAKRLSVAMHVALFAQIRKAVRCRIQHNTHVQQQTEGDNMLISSCKKRYHDCKLWELKEIGSVSMWYIHWPCGWVGGRKYKHNFCHMKLKNLATDCWQLLPTILDRWSVFPTLHAHCQFFSQRPYLSKFFPRHHT